MTLDSAKPVNLPTPKKPREVGRTRLSALLLLGLAIAAGSLHTILGGFFWWIVAVFVATVVLGSAALVRLLLRPRWIGSVVAAVVAGITITGMFAADTATFFVIPTDDTWERFAALNELAQLSIQEQAIPADATDGILFMLVCAIAGIAVLLDIVAVWWRQAALSGIPFIVILAVPSIVQPSLSDPFFFAMVAIVYLVILRPRIGRIQPSMAIGLGALGVIGALVAPLVLPPVTSGSTSGTAAAVSTGINPMIDLGNDLRRANPTPALNYTTAAADGHYLRLTTLEEFRGREWAPVTVEEDPENDVSQMGEPPGLTTDVATENVSTRIDIENSVGRWLPVPYPASAIAGLEGDWYWEPDGLSVRTTESNMRGQEYSVVSRELTPTSNQLEAAPDSSDLPLAQVPEGLDPSVAETALEVVGDAETDYDKAVALQAWFRGGQFQYSEEAPVEDGFDGSGLDVIVPFLEARAGYCVHFSSTMAIMARTLGIPSRIVVGFTPGTAGDTNDDDETIFLVSSENLHAWPELYFEGVGWTRFEPTPGRGEVPQYLAAAEDDPATPDVNEANPTPTPTAAPTSTAAPVIPEDEQETASGAAAARDMTALWALVIALGIALVLLLPAIWRLARRANRRGIMHRGPLPASAGWHEIADTARDLGYEGAVSGTPRELTADLLPILGSDEAAIVALQAMRAAVEVESYATDAPQPQPLSSSTPVTPHMLHLVLARLRASATAPARLRAVLVPQSLLDSVFARRARGRI